MPERNIYITASIACAVIITGIILYSVFLGSPGGNVGINQFIVGRNQTSVSSVISALKSRGFIKSEWAFNLLIHLRGLRSIAPGGYDISNSMNAWDIAGVLSKKPTSVWVVIPEGLRKEEIADILSQNLGWTNAQKTEWITKDTSTDPNYSEGVYFPDTYLIPVGETPLQTANRLRANFEEKFAPYSKEASVKNIKWTTALTLASIIQREADGTSDMALISGILWNRLLASPPMKLQVDSTVQYVRGNSGAGWWAPIAIADEKINSPYNTYLHSGLPPHPICNPGVEAIKAALSPETTSCLYYIHDSSGVIHCSATYQGQQQNIQKYLK